MQFPFFDTVASSNKAYTRAMEPVCSRYGLTRNELDVILFLANNPELDRATDIVTHRGLSKSHVSLSVSTLEKRGLLVCRRGETDRRSVRLSLTPEAEAIAREGRQLQVVFFQRLFRGITREELEVLRSIALQVQTNISSMTPSLHTEEKDGIYG